MREFFRDVELSDYGFLSDIVPLNSYKYRDEATSAATLSDSYLLSFKYDEELRYFLLSDDCYYFPSLNYQYPKQAGDYFDEGRFQKNMLSDIFDQTNLFILRLDDNSIADTVGIVDVELADDGNEAIIVYEDFDETKYHPSDPRFYEFVEMTIISDLVSSTNDLPIEPYTDLTVDGEGNEVRIPTESITTLSSLEVGDYIYPQSPDDMFNGMEDNYVSHSEMGFGVAPLYSESDVVGYTTSYATVELSSTKVDITDLLRIYINYRKAPDGGIHLYFNYINYLNTPFVKFGDDRNVLADIIPNTYLKLAPKEEGILDIVVQFRKYEDNRVSAYKNATLLRYSIYNISDDKPKFVIRQSGGITKDSLSRFAGTRKLILNMRDGTWEIDGDSSQKCVVNLNIGIEHDFEDDAIFSFDLYYPNDVFSLNEYGNVNCAVEDMEEYLHVTTTRENIDLISIPFKTKYSQNEFHTKMNGLYLFETENEAIISSSVAMEIEGGSSTMKFENITKNVLVTEPRSNIVSENGVTLDPPVVGQSYILTEPGTTGEKTYPNSKIETRS